MQGSLSKWTNIWNGWQPRWFILDDGILSYYNSEDEVQQGCKGSLSVAAAEVAVCPNDHNRIDITIPGEQYLYVRASSEKERQQWLVALGSAKACLSGEGAGHDSQGARSRRSASPSDSLRTKKSELRLYCDMLMQQVHTINGAVANSPEVNLEKLNEGSALLSKTCDTFISTLEEVMALSDAAFVYTVQNMRVDDHGVRTHNSARKAANKPERSQHGAAMSMGRRRAVSLDVSTMGMASPGTPTNGFQSVFGVGGTRRPPRHRPASDSSPSHGIDDSDIIELPMQPPFPDSASGPRCAVASKDEDVAFRRIPAKDFLEASLGAAVLFELLDPKAFARINSDVQRSVQSLRSKLQSNPRLFTDVQAIVEYDMSKTSPTKAAKNGEADIDFGDATTALFWLVHNLMFLHNFLRRFIESADEVTQCLSDAYSETLHAHQGLVASSLFTVSIQKAPSRSQLYVALGVAASLDSEKQAAYFQTKVVPALALYLDPMESCLMTLTAFLKKVKPGDRTTTGQ